MSYIYRRDAQALGVSIYPCQVLLSLKKRLQVHSEGHSAGCGSALRRLGTGGEILRLFCGHSAS